ncbi:MAG: four helix bundle protein [Acidobacteriaceae bacterium]|nr:four helix bundle protein [Acidobacteriaceae bacterium]
MSHSYKDLIVWQKSKALATEIYRCTEPFPKTELYGLTSQLRRAAVSIPSNIAEGQGRLTRGEFQQFLGHARGSLLELETQLGIAVDLNYLDNSAFDHLESRIAEVSRLLNGLLESLHCQSKAAGA